MKNRNRFSRSLAGLVAAAAMCASLPAIEPAAAQTLVGDVDQNGKVGVSDVVLLYKYLHKLSSLDQTGYDNADVMADGTVDIFDLAMLKKMVISTPAANTVYIHLKGNSITVEGDDNQVVQISGTTAKITGSGIYYVDGSITDGQLYIETAADDTDDVELVLSDVTFENNTKPAIYTSADTGSDKTKITVTGTNTITDVSASAYTDSDGKKMGVVYSGSKLTITKNSTGTLNINSSVNTAIKGKKKINLNGGVININTADLTFDGSGECDADAINSSKSIEIEGAVINIDASADGINADDVTIYSGDVSIKAGNDAIQASTLIDVQGGNVIASGDRGFRLDASGTLNIDGGSVLATATDYQVNGNEAISITGKQAVMLLDMAAEWKKSATITVGTKTYTSNKKYDYVLVSDSSISANSNQKVYIDGQQAKHEADANGNFQNAGSVTQYKAVELLAGGETVPAGTVVSSIIYSSSSVALYDANGTAIEASAAENVTVSNGTYVTITKSGEYTLSGSSSNGQIKVSTDNTAEPDAVVEMSFEGLELSNSSVAPVYIENVGDEAVISAKKGTVNTISDGTNHTDTYVNSDGETKTVNGAIFSRDDLKIKGKGTLNVTGNYAYGIACKNDLKLWNGTINVTAVDDGIRGNDSVRIGDPDDTDYSNLNITVNTNKGTTGGDGIKANNDEDESKGYVTINGGTVNINAYSDGIQAEQAFTMNGGDVTIYTYSGHTYTGSGSGSSWGGGFGGGMGQDGNSNKADISAKGIKCSSGDLNINGGTLNIDSSDDSLHCAGNMNVLGGTMTLASADDAMHSDSDLTIGVTGGDYNTPYIDITYSYEGVEGLNITQNSGSVMVYSTDDGFNAAGGTDNSGNGNTGGPGGGWGQGGWGNSSSSGDMKLIINGGYTYVNAAGDGLDSNGTLAINGGYVFVSQTGGGNSPIDCDTTWTYSGGVVIAGGSSDMFSESIPASYQFVNSSGAGINAGDVITFADSNGTVIGTMTFANSAAAIVVCGPQSGTVYKGGTVSGATYFATGAASTNMKAGYGGSISGGSELSSSGSGSGSTGPGSGQGGPGNW